MQVISFFFFYKYNNQVLSQAVYCNIMVQTLRYAKIASLFCLFAVSSFELLYAENKCQRIFTCERCIATPECGWCDGVKYKLCQYQSQK